MSQVVDYRIFFELRDKYQKFPKRCSLLGDLMRFSFEHHDRLPTPDVDYLYLKDCYSKEDIKLIFEELNLPYFKILSSSHPKVTTIVQLNDTSQKGKKKP